ncbi:MAG: hypothetical protein AUI04_06610 [Candidatus Rokubacteria bacterium 13_2_20CM_2_64_8]|nr:MAG: hypothetical protein AUI04_06610 [Candidatus Rokubacteria bacterium 13_2_20CM_2_64_8]
MVTGVAAVLATHASGQTPRPGGVSGPQTSLAQAVRVAEQQTGGRARKAEMERKQGTYVYEIKTLSKDKSAKVLVDPASGNIVRIVTPGVISSLSHVFDRKDQLKEQAALARLEASPMGLVAAIEAAEKETGGRGVEAALANLYGATLFEVKVVKDLTVQRVVVDPATGKVAAVPSRGKHKDHDD